MENYILKWFSIFCVVPSFDARRVRFTARFGQVLVFIVFHLSAIVVYIWLNHYCLFEFESTLIMCVNSIYSTLNLCFFNIEKFENLLRNLKLLQLQLVYVNQKSSSVSKFGFVAVNLVIIILVLPLLGFLDGFKDVNITAVILAGTSYIMHLQGLLQIYLLISIRDKFKSVNCCIAKLQEHTDLITSTNKLYTKLCASVTTFNEIFAWNVLLRLITFFMSLMFQFYIFVVLIEKITQEGMLVMILPKIVVQLVQVVVLSKVCQDLLQENEVSFKNLVLVLSTVKDESARKQLLALKQDVNIYRPRVSAAGFFDVNHAMLFMLFNLMVTYLIAMGQLMPN